MNKLELPYTTDWTLVSELNTSYEKIILSHISDLLSGYGTNRFVFTEPGVKA